MSHDTREPGPLAARWQRQWQAESAGFSEAGIDRWGLDNIAAGLTVLPCEMTLATIAAEVTK